MPMEQELREKGNMYMYGGMNECDSTDRFVPRFTYFITFLNLTCPSKSLLQYLQYLLIHIPLKN